MHNGYFFRQYPLVKDGQVIDNEPKGKSIRRAICDRQGEIFMVETGSIESFHDFAQALADLGVDRQYISSAHLPMVGLLMKLALPTNSVRITTIQVEEECLRIQVTLCGERGK